MENGTKGNMERPFEIIIVFTAYICAYQLLSEGLRNQCRESPYLSLAAFWRQINSASSGFLLCTFFFFLSLLIFERERESTSGGEAER